MRLRNPLTFLLVTAIYCLIGYADVAAEDYLALQVGNRWVYQPGYGDGDRVDTIIGTETRNGTLTYIVKREESAPDNYQEKFWIADDGTGLKLHKIWSNMGLADGSDSPLVVDPPAAWGFQTPSVGATATAELHSDSITIRFTTTVDAVSETVIVPAGVYKKCLATRTVTEIAYPKGTIYQYNKDWYAPDVGLVRTENYGDSEWLELHHSQNLVSFTNAGPLHIDIHNNWDRYPGGGTLKTRLSIYNSGACVDALLAVALKPEGSGLYFYPDFSVTYHPVIDSPITICGSPFVDEVLLVQVNLPAGMLLGTHIWYAALIDPAEGADPFLAIDQAPFTVTSLTP